MFFNHCDKVCALKGDKFNSKRKLINLNLLLEQGDFSSFQKYKIKKEGEDKFGFLVLKKYANGKFPRAIRGRLGRNATWLTVRDVYVRLL